MKLGHREHSVHAFQILNVADDHLFVNIEDSHQVGAQMRYVKPAAVAIETLIVEACRTSR